MEKLPVGVKGYRVIWNDLDGNACEREFDYDSAENNFGAMYNFAEKVKHDGCEPIVIEETQQILVEGINR